MPAKIKIRRKDLKKDPLSIFLLKTFELLREYRQHYSRKIIKGGAVIGIVLGIGLGFSFWKTRFSERAEALFSKAQLVFQGDGEKGKKEGNNGEKSAQYLEAIKLFKEVLKRYPWTQSHTYSYFYLGHCYFNLGNYKEAINNYQKFLKKVKEEFLKERALFNLALSYEANGEPKKAIQSYEKILKMAKYSFSHPEALYRLGKCFEKEGNDKKALYYYQKLLKDYPTVSYSLRKKAKESSLWLKIVKKVEASP
jgi:tetratricopeptide (TPR) repeat protein